MKSSSRKSLRKSASPRAAPDIIEALIRLKHGETSQFGEVVARIIQEKDKCQPANNVGLQPSYHGYVNNGNNECVQAQSSVDRASSNAFGRCDSDSLGNTIKLTADENACIQYTPQQVMASGGIVMQERDCSAKMGQKTNSITNECLNQIAGERGSSSEKENKAPKKKDDETSEDDSDGEESNKGTKKLKSGECAKPDETNIKKVVKYTHELLSTTYVNKSDSHRLLVSDNT